mgnify:CR=1 FL=1
MTLDFILSHNLLYFIKKYYIILSIWLCKNKIDCKLYSLTAPTSGREREDAGGSQVSRPSDAG